MQPPQPTTNPPEGLMLVVMEELELLSPHHHHHQQQQLANDAQLHSAEQSLQPIDQSLLLSDPHLFSNDVNGFDYLAAELFNNAELSLDNLDPIFAGLHVVTPKSVSDNQIPLVVEEYMDLQ